MRHLIRLDRDSTGRAPLKRGNTIWSNGRHSLGRKSLGMWLVAHRRCWTADWLAKCGWATEEKRWCCWLVPFFFGVWWSVGSVLGLSRRGG
jgi:hypothetical protein